jgi:hypothetical protein
MIVRNLPATDNQPRERPHAPTEDPGEETAGRRRLARWSSGPMIVGYVAALKLLLHLATAGLYGFFIDELYFLACGQHLAWGYVDMAPLTAVQAWLARALFGDSPLAIRLFPALAGAAAVLLTGAIVRQLGGGRYAQGLAALAVLVAPLYLFFGSYLSMNSIELALWPACALVLIRLIKTGDTRLWLAFGVLAGLGMENKHTMAVFAFALIGGLALTPQRRLLWSRHLLFGGVIAGLLFLPNFIWMAQHHFPLLELLANIKRNGRNIEVTPLQFLGMQVLIMNPASLPIWAGGLGWLLASAAGRQFRALGWAYLLALAILLLTQGRVYYLGPAYTMLFAAGAVGFEAWLARPRLRWAKPALVAVPLLTGALVAPTVVPLMPAETYLRYSRAIGIRQPRIEHRRAGPMPQFFADRFGWPEMAQTVARVYRSLPAEERRGGAIFGNDFGQSGAIDFYGPALGLPKSIGNHLTNWYWGPRGYTGECMIVLGDDASTLRQKFASVVPAAEIGHPYAMAQEHFTVFLCRKPRGWTLPEIWPRLKNWN